MPFHLSDILAVAVLSLNEKATNANVYNEIFLQISTELSIPVYTTSGGKDVHSVSLSSSAEWSMPNPSTLVCPRSAGGLIAQYIFRKTRNLSLAYEVKDYDPILEAKFQSGSIQNGALVAEAIKLPGILSLFPTTKFDADTAITGASDPWGLVLQVPRVTVVPSAFPAILPVLLGASNGDLSTLQSEAQRLLPQNPLALQEMAASVRSVVHSKEEFDHLIQSSIDMLQFGPWSSKVADLRRVFPKKDVGVGLDEKSKEALTDLIGWSPILLNVGKVLIGNLRRVPKDITLAAVEKGNLPDDDDFEEAVETLKILID